MIELFISTDGRDSNPGSRDKPFASLVGARDAIRALRREEKRAGGVTVRLRGGRYPVRESLILEEQDSGTRECPVVYCAAEGEAVTLFGGRDLDLRKARPVDDPGILARIISEDARTRVLQVDLREQGITDYGRIARRGFRMGEVVTELPPLQFYIDGQRQHLARWPKCGYVSRDAKNAQAKDGIVDPGPKYDDADFWTRGGTFAYDFDRPEKWTQADDIWLNGVFSWSWEWSYNKVKRIDLAKRHITLAYGEVSGIVKVYSADFFFAENLLEELDAPGEYFLDRGTGILYFIPPAGAVPGESRGAVTMLRAPMLSLRDASHVAFRNLVFDMGRYWAAEVYGGEDVCFENCEVSNFSGGGILFQSGWNNRDHLTLQPAPALPFKGKGRGHRVASCHIHDIGGSGVIMSAGDPETLEPGNCVVEDCHIHHFAWYQRVYNTAISLVGVGNKALHNKIHDSPHVAVWPSGNDHLVEFNEIYNVVLDYTDMGAIDMNLGHLPQQRGTIIRHNYLHHIGLGNHHQDGVYLDNGTMGVTVEGNVFHLIGGFDDWSSRATKNNGGAYNRFRNNVFIDCHIPYNMGVWFASMPGEMFEKQYLAPWREIFARYDFARLPHGRKYPELLKFWDEERQRPVTSVFERNVIFNRERPLCAKNERQGIDQNGLEDKFKLTQIRDNWVSRDDPGFVDYANGDFRLRPDAPVFKHVPGFEPIPFERMGLTGPVGPAPGIPPVRK